MGYAVQDMHDLLALAGLLRRFAQDHDARDLFLETAAALEARAFFLATSRAGMDQNPEQDAALHAPVNLLV